MKPNVIKAEWFDLSLEEAGKFDGHKESNLPNNVTRYVDRVLNVEHSSDWRKPIALSMPEIRYYAYAVCLLGGLDLSLDFLSDYSLADRKDLCLFNVSGDTGIARSLKFCGFDDLKSVDCEIYYPLVNPNFDGEWDEAGFHLQVAPDEAEALAEYVMEVSQALGKEVAEEFGEEYGKALRGTVDGGGIWFEGLEVGPDKKKEIWEFCVGLVSDKDWRQKAVPDRHFEDVRPEAEMRDWSFHPVGCSQEDYDKGEGRIVFDEGYDEWHTTPIGELDWEESCAVGNRYGVSEDSISVTIEAILDYE